MIRRLVLVTKQWSAMLRRNDITLPRPEGMRTEEWCDHPESFQTAEGLGLQSVVKADLDAVVMAQ